MTSPRRIDHLRNLAAAIGKRQIEYHHFFPSFADRLERELGMYLGEAGDVALCCATGEFKFEQGRYRHEGLGFVDGMYRIPLMIRLRNLHDEGSLNLRIRLRFTKDDNKLSALVESSAFPVEFWEADLTPLLDHIYAYLCACLEESNWFEKHPDDYQGTAMGFTSGR